MKFFDKLKEILTRNKANNNIKELQEPNMDEIKSQLICETYKKIELPEGKLVSFSEEVLDTNSKEAEEKLKHNLEILIKQAKERGKIDKFMLIREDDFFPTDWEWNVLSKNTNLENVCTPLSNVLREKYALEQSGINPFTEVMGIKVSTSVTHEQKAQAMSKIDKNLGMVKLPSRFRSTKHFTINTPLEVTGNYNNVPCNRDYIIIDDINEFLKSDYGYSVSYHDAYLDVSHESLSISERGIVLIDDAKYEKIMSDKKIASELEQRRVVRYKGDSFVAVNMVLTEMGALPSTIGSKYANYDQEIYDILNSSIKNLATENNLFFDKSHGGELKPDGGHFSSYYDEKNEDYEKAIKEFWLFLKQKFPQQEQLFSENLQLTEHNSQALVEELGTITLLNAINEYNELANDRNKKAFEQYKEDRKKITPEIHQKFVKTVKVINEYYKNDVNNSVSSIEESIQNFMQGDTVSEQLKASDVLLEILNTKEQENQTSSINHMESKDNNIITPAQATKNALKTASISEVNKIDYIEKLEMSKDDINKGESRND